MSYLPTITVTSAPPSARVTFTAANLHPSVYSITAYRIVEGVSFSVRTAIRLYSVGGTVFVDAEIPVGTSVSYRAQQYDSNGNELGFTDSAAVTIPAPDPRLAWLSDPLDATTAIQVTLSSNAAKSPTRKTPGTLHKVGTRTVALVGQRGLLEDLNLDFFTTSDADRDAVDLMLQRTGGLILVRTAPPVPVPRLLYVWAGAAVADDFDPGGAEGAAWSNKVQEVSPTDGPIVVGAATWQRYIDAFPLWSDFNAAYLTWFDALGHPPEV